MADISKIVLPDNNEYEIKDAKARMVILCYGISTWEEFIAAYTNNCVVYCRASSNNDPAAGTQTRLAFMTYVTDTTNPTSVEFQYYHSVSNKSAIQPVDQVFVYTLTNNNSWSVTVRNASSTVAAGNNLTSSYANETITLNADYDNVVTSGSSKLITSGAVSDAIAAVPSIPTLPITSGTFNLQVTLVEGEPVYTWVQQQPQPPSGPSLYSMNLNPTIRFNTSNELTYTMEITYDT